MRLPSLAFAAVTSLALVACSKKDPPRANPSGEPPDLGSASLRGFVVPPPSAMIMPDSPVRDADVPYGETTSWAKAKLAGTRLTLRYPSDVFLMDEEKDTLVLTSTVTVAPIDDDSGVPPKPYSFRGRFTTHKAGLAETAKTEKLFGLFPEDKVDAFTEAEGLRRKGTVAKHAAYIQKLGMHGFGQTVYLVELEPKKTLVARFDTVGDELRARVDESNFRSEKWQLGLIELVMQNVSEGK